MDAELKAQEEAYRPRIHHDPDSGEMTSFVSFNGKSHPVSTRPRPDLQHQSGEPVWQTAIFRSRRFLPRSPKMWRAGSHIGDSAKAEDYHVWIVASVATRGPDAAARVVGIVNT